MKTLYVPGRVWLSSKSFVEAYPQAALAMIVLLGDATLTKKTDGKTIKLTGEYGWSLPPNPLPTFSIDLGIDQYRYNKKIEAYRDIIRYIISPQMPMTISFLSGYDKKEYAPVSFKTTGRCEGMKLEKYQLALILFEYLNELDIIEKDKKYGGSSPYLCMMVYKNQLIREFAEKAFQYFEVRSSQENIDFNEVYNVFDPAQMQPNTISYCVVKEPPPVPEDIRWNTVDFWSAVFEDDVGKNILQAVTAHLPVKIKTTVTDWKDPNSYLSKATYKVTKEWVISSYTYVWQDFNIEVYEGNKIIVKYNRDTATKTLQWKVDQSTWWGELLKGIAFLAIVAGAGYVAGAWGGATGIVSGSAPSATGIISGGGSGITLTAPGYVAPHLTGVTALTSQTFTIGSATYASASAAVLPVAAKATVWSTILKASPSVLAAVGKAGVGLWSASEQAKIQEELMKAGYGQYSNLIPEGMTADGQFAYAAEAGFLGMDTETILLFGGGALVLLLALKKT